MKRLLRHHAQVLVAALGALWRRPLSSALTLGGIGVALAVPLTLYVLVGNLSSVYGDFEQTATLSLYVDRAAGDDAAEHLAATLAVEPRIAATRVIGRDQGLEQLLANDSLRSLRGRLVDNPLPDVLEVVPVDGLEADDYRALASQLEALDGVSEVQIDLTWVSRLRAVTELATAAVRVFWLLLFAGVAMVISNSVRLSLVTARAEIEVISLVGGSEAFIRRPYLYAGALQGVLGALLAVAVALAVHLALSPAMARLMDAYLGTGEGAFASPGVLLRMVAGAGLLGWLAAWLTVTRFLRGVLPR